MIEEMKEYDLGPDEGITDHDAVCMSQAGKLLEIGYLEYETAAYGTAYAVDHEIYYYSSAREGTMARFLQQCLQKNIYPTPVKYFCKRYDLIHDTAEEIKRRFRLEIASQLQAAYPPVFFEAMESLTSPSSENAAFAILQELTTQLDSCFDLKQLYLYGQLLEMMLQSRLLSKEGYQILLQWLTREYEKIAVEPIASGDYRRTYAGFAYRKPGGMIKYFCDAFPYMATEKQILFFNQGYVVTPILTKTYYADSFQGLEGARADFSKNLNHDLGEMYLRLMELLRSLPATVDALQYAHYQQQIQQTGSKQAITAYRYYGYLWNLVSL